MHVSRAVKHSKKRYHLRAQSQRRVKREMPTSTALHAYRAVITKQSQRLPPRSSLVGWPQRHHCTHHHGGRRKSCTQSCTHAKHQQLVRSCTDQRKPRGGHSYPYRHQTFLEKTAQRPDPTLSRRTNMAVNYRYQNKHAKYNKPPPYYRYYAKHEPLIGRKCSCRQKHPQQRRTPDHLTAEQIRLHLQSATIPPLTHPFPQTPCSPATKS